MSVQETLAGIRRKAPLRLDPAPLAADDLAKAIEP